MSRLSAQRLEELTAMGRAPISLPAEIYFGGNETLQKSPGKHHLPQYQKTGTYNHPDLKAWRKRVAMDLATRLINGKLSDITLRKVGGLGGIAEKLAEFNLKIDQEQWQIAELNASFLDAEYKAKKQSQEEGAAQEGRQRIAAEPVNPTENIVRMAEQAAAAKVTGVDNLASGDEDEKENNETRDGVSVNFTEL